MQNSTIYRIEPYNDNYSKIFAGVYNNFKENAVKDYNFELEPLTYENFIKSIKGGLIQCIILFEDNIPTGFLAYTTLISEAIELNIIHCIGENNINKRRCLLLEKFIEINKHIMREKVVTYPMLGKQMSFESDIVNYGFKTVNTAVMMYNLAEAYNKITIKEYSERELGENYAITSWDRAYKKNAIEVIQQSFKESSDALFDSRFLTYSGCSDILEKITENIYGEFLGTVTKVLLYKKHPVGFCFANLTNDKIANIPIMAILKKHRGNGYSKIILKQLIDDLINLMIIEGRPLKELNVSCDADNVPAVRMYTSSGFKTCYTYPIAYHSGLD